MMIQRRSAAALILAAAIAFPAFAADPAQWANLGELRRGQRIGVIQTDQKRVEGSFEAFTDSSISLRADGEIVVAKEKVVRVYRRPRANRGVRALIGGAIGAAAGILLTNTAGDRFRNEGQDVPAGLWVGGGAGIGAGMGALTGGGYKTIYQQPVHPSSSGRTGTARLCLCLGTRHTVMA